MPRRVLVTGATGCIGRSLVPILLGAGCEVHALARHRPDDMPEGIEWHTGDLLAAGTPDAVTRAVGADTLVHLAWYIAPGRWAAAPQNVEWVRASLDLVRAWRAHGGRRVVVSGSCLEYDWRYGYCTEGLTPCEPHTLYGTAKHALHQLLDGLAGAESDLSVAWARVFFLYGPHEHADRLVASVTRSLLAGQDARVSHGRQIRDYLCVDDVARALVRLVETPRATGAFNVCSGQPVALRSIVEEIATQLGASDRVRFGAIPAAATDTPLVVGAPGRLTTELGWTPAESLASGIARTIAWWRPRVRAIREDA